MDIENQKVCVAICSGSSNHFAGLYDRSSQSNDHHLDRSLSSRSTNIIMIDHHHDRDNDLLIVVTDRDNHS